MQKAGQKIKTNQSLRLDFIKYLVSKQDVSRNEELEIPLNIDESHVRVRNRLFERHMIAIYVAIEVSKGKQLLSDVNLPGSFMS